MITEGSMMSLVNNDVNTVKIPDDIPDMEYEDYDLMDDKDREKYITDLERFVRSSYEYKQMVSYLRDYRNMNSCAFIPAVSNETNRKIRIELHHSPLTLRDICTVIMNKRTSKGEMMTIESVAHEVMFAHYSLMIGLIPLSETVHELVHTQYLFIPVDKVYGYYRNFISTYYNWIDPETLDRLDAIEKMSKDGTYNEVYKQVLEKQYIAVDMGVNDQSDKLPELQKALKSRMKELRDDTPKNNSNVDYSNSTIMSPDNR